MSYTCIINPAWRKWDPAFQYDGCIFTRHNAIGHGQFWRFYTYSFVHAGTDHLIGNMIFQIGAGIPLEYIHGSIRILFLYNLGVIAGSMTALVVTPDTTLIGNYC